MARLYVFILLIFTIFSDFFLRILAYCCLYCCASLCPAYQDGGEGHLGSLVEPGSSTGWWTVKWDGSESINSYRVGNDGKHDLKVSGGPGGRAEL